MKKTSAFFIALFAILAMPLIMSVMATAISTEVAGTATLSVTSIGDIRITKSGIMHQVGAQASGPIIGATLSGQMQIELDAAFNMNTGEGVAWGTFVISDAQGTFEGMFRVKDTDFIQFKGTGEGHGTGAYGGMMVQLLFQGEDLYRAGYTGPDGLTMTYSGRVLSPKGI